VCRPSCSVPETARPRIFLASLLAFVSENLVIAANAPELSLNLRNAAPRKVEEATRKAVVRHYATAWQAMTEALDRNQG